MPYTKEEYTNQVYKNPKNKVEEMFNLLVEHGVNAGAIKDALRSFKDKYPHVTKHQTISYFAQAFKSTEMLGLMTFMNKDKKYPCPFDNKYKCRKGNTCRSRCTFIAY